jgi:hypothetical protein
MRRKRKTALYPNHELATPGKDINTPRGSQLRGRGHLLKDIN